MIFFFNVQNKQLMNRSDGLLTLSDVIVSKATAGHENALV